MGNKHKDFFWPSYVDLLTALFIVMLVLFVLSYKLLSDSKKSIEEELVKIQEIQNAVSELPDTLFQYQQAYKRFTLNKQIEFPKGLSLIPLDDTDYLIEVGTVIRNKIRDLSNKFNQDSIKYLLVIEGMASKDGYTRNYQLSYDRAKAVYDLWLKNSINFDPSVCEVMISGSGTGGVREFFGEDEPKNQRILIQIVPKLSYKGDGFKTIQTRGSQTKGIDTSMVSREIISSEKLVPKPKIIENIVEIYSYPAQSIIEINDKSVGLTPLVIKLKAGTYAISIYKDGYQFIQDQIHVVDSVKNIFPFTLVSVPQ